MLTFPDEPLFIFLRLDSAQLKKKKQYVLILVNTTESRIICKEGIKRLITE